MKRERNLFKQALGTVVIAVAFVLTAGIPASPLLADIKTSSVGSLEGRFHASSNGDAVYEVKIPVPPGIQKVQPTLSLHYVSSAPNGIVGVGWRLSGLSVIGRCAAIPVTDGVRGTVTYTPSDRFCLDGTRLIAVEGQVGADGTVYRTERETFRKIVSKGTAGSGPASFEVHRKDGSIWLYGATADSRILATGKSEARVFALSSITDRNHNRLDVTYTADPLGRGGSPTGQFYPLRIDYTANAAASPPVTANRSVVFTYEDRPDAETTNRGGSKVATLVRLKQIETRLGGAVVNDVTLSYALSPATGRSLLQSMVLAGRDGSQTVRLTPTDLTWQGQVASTFASPVDTATGGGSASLALWPMDVDGDGQTDLVQAWDSGGTLQLTTYPAEATGGFGAAVTTSTGQSTSHLHFWPADVDGDGRDDLVQAWQGSGQTLELLTYLSQGGGRFADPVATSTGQSSAAIGFWTVDLNGDGQSDILQAWQGSGQTLQLQAYLAKSDGRFMVGQNTATGSGSSHLALWPMDVNGDHMTDLVQAFDEQNSLELVAYLSTGTGFSQGVSTSTGGAAVAEEIFPADANGDGLMDILQTWSKSGTLQFLVYQARGDGTFAAGVATDTGRSSQSLHFWPMDVNGDHRTDLVQGFKDGRNRLSLTIYRATGSGTYDSGVDVATGRAPTALAFWPGDVNGDGRSDLLQAWQGGGGTLELSTFLAAGDFPDLLASFVDGLGGRFRMTYRPMSDESVYCPGPRDPGGGTTEALAYRDTLSPTVMPIQVVAGGNRQLLAGHLAENDPGKNSRTYSYAYTHRYSAAKIDHDGRGWLGFATSDRLEQSPGKLTSTTYNQPYPKSGTVDQVTVRGASSLATTCAAPPPSGPVQSVIATEYVVTATATGTGTTQPKVELVRPAKIRRDHYDGGTYAFSLGSTFTYDTFGNPSLISKLGKVDRSGTNTSTADDVFTCLDYDNETSPWIVGLERVKKESASSDCSSISTFRPGTDLTLKATEYTADGRFNEAAGKSWDDQNNAWVTFRYAYDAFGNQRSTTDPEGATTTIAYETTYHTYPETTTMPEVNGQKLAKRFAYDPRSGLLVATVDPNGHTSVKCSDAFGRLVAFQGPVPPPYRGDASCLTSTVTGPASIRQAPVVTLGETTWTNESGAFATTTRQLATWTTSGSSEFLEQKSYFDGLRRSYRHLREAEAAGSFIVECTDYNAAGQVVQRSLPQIGTTCGASTLWITTDYDLQGRPTRVDHPSGSDGKGSSVTTYAYSGGDTTTVTQASGTSAAWVKKLGHTYLNGQARIVSMSFPGEGGAATTYAYDRLARLLRVTDPPTTSNPQGVTNAVTYDSLGNMLTVTDPDRNVGGSGPALTFTYENHRLLTKKDVLGHVTRYQYDALGRRSRETHWDGTQVISTFDGAGQANGKGRLTSARVKRPDGTVESSTAFTYDAYGREASRKVTILGEASPYTLAKTWEPTGQLASFTYPDGKKLVHDYTRGALTGLTLDGASVATYSRFDAYGHPQTTAFGNAVTGTRSYSPTGHPLSHAVTASSGKLLNYALAWNVLDQLTSLTDHATTAQLDRSQSFAYDSLRLQKATGAKLYGAVTYAYDASGNLTGDTGVDVTYEAHRPKKGTKGGRSVFSLDYYKNGFLKTKTTPAATWSLELDGRDRVSKVSKDGTAVESGLLYDHAGRRLKRVDAAGNTVVYVDSAYQVTRFADGKTETTKVVVGHGGAVAAVTAGTSGAGAGSGGIPALGTLYFHRDYLGSILLTTTAAGGAGTQIAYVPYGAIAQGTPQGADDFRPKFQGKELDEDAGLYYFGARYYDPQTARFASPDSRLGWGHPYRQDAFNRYAFGLNNPLTFVDPSGHLSRFWDEFISITVSVLEIGLGVAAEFIPGVGPVIGAALIGAGVSGLVYSGQTLATGHKFSWKEWGIQEGVGAIGGAVTGGLGTAGGIAAGRLATTGAEVVAEDTAEAVAADASTPLLRAAAEDGAENAARTTGNLALKQGAVRVGFTTAGGALAPVVTTPFKNWWEGKGFNEHGLTVANVVEGGLFGFVGGAASVGIGSRVATEEAENVQVGQLIPRFGGKTKTLFQTFMPFTFNTKKVLYQTGVLPK